MAITKKSSMASDVFTGISAVYAVAGGFNTTESSGAYTATLGNEAFVELPVSEDSGLSLSGGEASINHFKVKGLGVDWASTITPGDGSELTLEIPTYNDEVMALVFGNTGSGISATLPAGLLGSATKASGKSYTGDSKFVTLGLFIVNDTEDKALFIKKAKLCATPSFDGSEKPYCVTLTGTIANAGENDAMCILEKQS